MARRDSLAARARAQRSATGRAYTGKALHHELRYAAGEIVRLLAEQDIYAVGTSGYRSIAKQRRLYAVYLRGGPLAAAPGRSAHQYGLAFDIALPDYDPDSWRGRRAYAKMHAIARDHGLETLEGDELRADPYHIQWPNWRSYAASHPQTAKTYARYNG